MLRHPSKLIWILSLFFLVTKALPVLGQNWDYTDPIPLSAPLPKMEKMPATNIFFFKHPAIPGSTGNFATLPSVIRFDGNVVMADDIVATPGFSWSLPSGPAGHSDVNEMLADPAGLCHENWLLQLACSTEILTDNSLNRANWAQHMVADIRNKEVPSTDWVFEAAKNESLFLGSITANMDDWEGAESPEAICHDIIAAEDWLACPVFGKIYVRLPKYDDRPPQVDNIILQKRLAKELIEIQSPVIIYRRGKTDPRYHLSGYLSNPTFFDYALFDQDNPARHLRLGNPHFPMAIAAGNFSEHPNAKHFADIAVMGTATLPHLFCATASKIFATEGKGNLPHGLGCTSGLTWVRTAADWNRPLQENFDSLETLIGGSAIYDMVAGLDSSKSVLFAPSNLPAKNGKVYVYKYYENGMDPFVSDLIPGIGKIVPPRAIAVKSPHPKLGPYKIAVGDVTGDGYADFALTWKIIQDKRSDTEHHLWSSVYAPKVSLFKSQVVRTPQGVRIEYQQVDSFVPMPNGTGEDKKAQLATVAFGKRGNQQFMVVGNQKRNEMNGANHTLDYLFPISSDGVLDNLNVKVLQASAVGNSKAAGASDIAVDSYGNIATLSSAPFLRAPEGCKIGEGEVYGALWSMRSEIPGQPIQFLDADFDGVPNRCECLNLGLPDENNDQDFDELIDDPACDTCLHRQNIGDAERNAAGRIVGDDVDDACDNCPASRCTGDIPSALCINPNQEDGDGDEIGDSCDNCPALANPQQGKVYLFVDNNGKPEPCVPCPNAYFLPDGSSHTVVPFDEYYEKVCSGTESMGTDSDHDGIFDPRDNCMHVPNPDQRDSDQDQSGDACDCGSGGAGQAPAFNTGPEDNCDNDSVPNRFDRSPFSPSVARRFETGQHYAHLDTVYDPQAGYIAEARDLIPAGSPGGGVPVPQFTFPITPIIPLCGYSSREYPGPIEPCGYSTAGGELTVMLGKSASTGPGTGREGEKPVTTPGGSVGSRCIVKVGRGGPKTMAAFESDQKYLQELNGKVRDITGIADYDLFVGSEVGIAHLECLFDGGAAIGVSKASNVLPNVSGNIAPFGVWQTQGLPPLDYVGRPPLDKAIQEGEAFRVAPQVAAGSEAGAGKAAGVKSEVSASLPMPDIAAVMPDVRKEILPEEGVQAGELAFNINGKALVKVLTSESIQGSGAELNPNDFQSVIAMDWKAFAEPYFEDKPIENRSYNVNAVLEELRRRVADRKAEGAPIAIDIYHDLPWETAMRAEFVMAQNTVPEAVAALGKSMQAGSSAEAINQSKIQLLVAPANLEAAGGGCGCRFQSAAEWPALLMEWVLFILIFSGCMVLRTVCIRKKTKIKSSTKSGIV